MPAEDLKTYFSKFGEVEDVVSEEHGVVCPVLGQPLFVVFLPSARVPPSLCSLAPAPLADHLPTLPGPSHCAIRL